MSCEKVLGQGSSHGVGVVPTDSPTEDEGSV